MERGLPFWIYNGIPDIWPRRSVCSQQLSKADIAVELCDARIPLSSRNPDLDRMLAGKRRMLLLCKADLADGGATSRWLRFFDKARHALAMAYDTTPQKTKRRGS